MNKKNLLIISIIAILLLLLIPRGQKISITSPFTKKESTTRPIEEVRVETKITPQEAQKIKEGDESFTQVMSQVQSTYPWYRKFPIATEEYLVVFDYEKESFRLVFKVPYTKALEDEIVAKIKDITKLDKVNYYVK